MVSLIHQKQRSGHYDKEKQKAYRNRHCNHYFGCGIAIYRYYIPDMKPKKQFTPAAVEYTYDDSVTSSQLAEYNARQDWQLTLVNNDTLYARIAQ